MGSMVASGWGEGGGGGGSEKYSRSKKATRRHYLWMFQATTYNREAPV